MTVEVAILAVALVGGLYMAWNIGANDVANAMGTSVGSGALTLGAAVVLAGIFEFLGAVLVGAHVTDTVRGRIIDIALFEPTGELGEDGPLLLALGMLSALIAAGLWLHLATMFSLPVSTTHSIVGAVVGFGIVSFGLEGVQWSMLGGIVASWFVSPLLGGTLAFTSFYLIRQRILHSSDPIGQTWKSAPWIVAVVVTIIVLSFVYKVLGSRWTPRS
jgi:inorganic phosphate transporter, PiT family